MTFGRCLYEILVAKLLYHLACHDGHLAVMLSSLFEFTGQLLSSIAGVSEAYSVSEDPEESYLSSSESRSKMSAQVAQEACSNYPPVYASRRPRSPRSPREGRGLPVDVSTSGSVKEVHIC